MQGLILSLINLSFLPFRLRRPVLSVSFPNFKHQKNTLGPCRKRCFHPNAYENKTRRNTIVALTFCAYLISQASLAKDSRRLKITMKLSILCCSMLSSFRCHCEQLQRDPCTSPYAKYMRFFHDCQSFPFHFTSLWSFDKIFL